MQSPRFAENQTKYSRRKSAGLCTHCGKKPHVEGILKCHECADKQKILGKQRYDTRGPAIKIEVMNAYGGCKCIGIKSDGSQCGESDVDVLALDHINGGGTKHRESLGSTGKGGWTFYQYLKNNHFPEGYQVLCMNCNWKKHLLHLRGQKCLN